MALLLRPERRPTRTLSPPLSCVVCGRGSPSVVRSADQLAHDLRDAQRSGAQILHQQPVAVFGCEGCNSLFRDPAAVGPDVVDRYRGDRYSRNALEAIHDRARADLERDASWLLDQGLEEGARILEIGSYTGAFLEFARDAGCAATGIDVGEETSAFARERGLDVSTEPFEARRFEELKLDGIWVLNCFEQLPYPRALVRDAARVLPPGGRLVIRTPSAEFVRRAHEESAPEWVRSLALANAVLGVPFVRCLSRHALVSMLVGNGFEVQDLRGRELQGGAGRRGGRWQSAGRRVRQAFYAGASVASGRFLYPWVDVVARRRGPAARNR